MQRCKSSKQVYSLFEKIADNYDRANSRISLGLHKFWRKLVTNDLCERLRYGARVIDVCCGTGDIALGIAKKRGDIRVLGVDFSPAMLDKAVEKSTGVENVFWRIADAMNLPYNNSSFDAACIAFGLRNTENYERVISELKRVVKKNGYIYCLESFVPDNFIIRPFYNIYFRYIMPLVGGGIKKYKEYTWLNQSTQIFLRKKELAELFKRLGLRSIRIKSRMFGACALIVGKK